MSYCPCGHAVSEQGSQSGGKEFNSDTMKCDFFSNCAECILALVKIVFNKGEILGIISSASARMKFQSDNFSHNTCQSFTCMGRRWEGCEGGKVCY